MRDIEEQVPACVLAERRGEILWLSINRPDRRNALNSEVLGQLEAAFIEAGRDGNARVIVLTGVGDKAFCAGADLTEGTGTFTRGSAGTTTDFGRLARVARGLPCPIIARVNGACVAGGMGLMALCDLAVAANHARFGLPEAKVGVFPMQVLVYLRSMMAPRHLHELCLTGDLISAERAWQMGLVNAVVPSDELDQKVADLAARISARSPMALERGRAVLAEMQGMGFHEALSYAEAQIALASASDDAREGISAFNERRSPRWVQAGAPER